MLSVGVTGVGYIRRSVVISIINIEASTPYRYSIMVQYIIRGVDVAL